MILLVNVICDFGLRPIYYSELEYLLFFSSALAVLLPIIINFKRKSNSPLALTTNAFPSCINTTDILGQQINKNQLKQHVHEKDAYTTSLKNRVIAVILILLLFIVPFADLLMKAGMH